MQVQDGISNNETVSNIPGPGRLLDSFYHAVGRRLEKKLGGLADKFGVGPDAMERYIKSWVLEKSKEKRGLDEDAQLILKKIGKLLKYTQ